jgi:polar amino acid transport system permease protein
MRRSDMLMQEHFQILEVYAAATAYYLILTSLWDLVQRRLEKHFGRSSATRSRRASATAPSPQAGLEARA